MKIPQMLWIEGFKLGVRLLMLKTEVMGNLSFEVRMMLMDMLPSYTINTN